MNKFLRFLFTLFVLMSLVATLSKAIDENETTLLSFDEDDDIETQKIHDNLLLDGQETSLRGIGRLLTQRRYHATMKCNKYPKTCHLKGSPGKSCCKKKCVNLFSDRLNCGMCGKKCKYPEICCKGKCVNTLNDKKNCGGCHKKCKKGHKCVHGMCNYS
ncbi:stigma-specific STIG1-like protein 1 [Impatiens glandulifera]|uniref:stigma-specific STIG1-like protein 1 n=1 Tax=Impatiens glandulifera TaxID=253017 RepID=UPI001FB0A5FC|nr:stigma-specific STIG1-like protein 1 [Impatiens glandulifera]